MSHSMMKAVVTTGDGKVKLKEVPVPIPKPSEVLVRVVAVGENPVDHHTVTFNTEPECILGYDFAGIVEQIGSDVPQGTRKIGERVVGSVHGGTRRDQGSYAEYLVVDAEQVCTLPDNLSFPGGATLSICVNTAFQMLYQSQNMATPFEPVKTPIQILVWSGATNVGQFLIQIAKASGYTVIATASQKNHDYLKSIGADVLFDYQDPEVAKKIREYTNDKLVHGFVCHTAGDERTNQLISDSLSSSGAAISTATPSFKPTRENISSTLPIAYTLYGVAANFPLPVPAIPEHKKAYKWYLQILYDLLSQGKIKTPPVKIMPNGLNSVAEAMELLKTRQVSAQKLVHLVTETPEINSIQTI